VSRSIKLLLPYPPRQLNPNRKQHWAQKAKHAKSYRKTCMAMTRAALMQERFELPGGNIPKGSVKLDIDFYPPDRRNRDDDNAMASFKAGRDGIAQALRCDDSIFRASPFLHSEPHPGGKVVVTITVR